MVVGSINVDLVVLVSVAARRGRELPAERLSGTSAGKGANQAVAAARLGSRVALVGAVGDDEAGRASLADLRAEGVDVAAVREIAKLPTGVALIVVDARGENQIAVASGANSAVDGELVRAQLAGWRPSNAGGVVLAVFEVDDEAIVAAARFAVAQGLRLVINPAPAWSCRLRWSRPIPIVIANRGEAETLTGHRDAKSAALALAVQTSAPAIITLGAEGALIANGGSVTRVPAPPVEPVDTTGAGDTFVGAFAAELARGASVEEAAHFAVVAASLSVTAPGARGGMPNRVRVEHHRTKLAT